MRFLINKSGGNINNYETVEITSNSFFNHQKNIVYYQKQNWFESKDDFKGRSI